MTSAAPPWSQAEIVRLMDAESLGDGRYRAPAHGACERNVVEGGQQLGAVVAAAAKEVREQHVTSVALAFSRAARHDLPLDLELDVLRRGRTQSTLQVRLLQGGTFCGAGTIHMDAGSVDLIRGCASLPPVTAPEALVDLDLPGFEVAGRQIRVVDNAYDWDPAHVGPPELFVWERFDEPGATPAMDAALLAHSTTHWTIAAALRPHAGYTEIDAHRTFSSGISMVTVAFHEPVDASQWVLYANRAIHAGNGTVQGEGRIHDATGTVVASYAVNAMVRPLIRTGTDSGRLM
jgi:acyl-CoA thioesterase-2